MSSVITRTSSFLSLFVLLACQPSSSGRTGGEAPPAQANSTSTSTVDVGPAPSASAKAPNLDGTFRLVLTDFHFEKGTEGFVVGSDGSVKDLFVRHELVKTSELCAKAKTQQDKDLCTQMRKEGAKEFGITKSFLARYTFPPETFSVFRSLLGSAKFETLEPSYSSSKHHDGVTNTYTLHAGDMTHRVSAYATGTPAEPEQLLAVRTFMQKQAQAHEAERKSAPELSFKELTAFQKDELGAP